MPKNGAFNCRVQPSGMLLFTWHLYVSGRLASLTVFYSHITCEAGAGAKIIHLPSFNLESCHMYDHIVSYFQSRIKTGDSDSYLLPV